MTFIPYGRQDISEQDIEAVVEVLRSEYLTQGPVISSFESAVSKKCSAKFAIATNSATSALHIACSAVGITKDDLVWTSPISFVASANCALYCGAKIDFVDIDPNTYNLSADKLEEKLVEAEKNDKLPKLVIPVHLTGQPCDMERIFALSQKYGFKIIEDASHAIGAQYRGSPVGSCKFSDITVFSFHPVKIITTGEGGMALTNSKELSAKMYRLKSHGITRNISEMTHVPDGPWYYQQIDLGFNYRMTDIQAALGLSQLNRIDEFIKNRHKVASIYAELLKDIPVKLPYQNPDSFSSFHLFVVRLKLKEFKLTQKQVFEQFRSSGIFVNLHYIPIYRQPYFAKMGFNLNDFPEAEAYYSEAISLPMYSTLKETEIYEVVNRLKQPLGFQTLF